MDDFVANLSDVLRYSVEQERAAFESNIDKEPLEASNHLVYSDWLTEHGEHEEAAFQKSLGEWKGTKPKTLHEWHPYFSGDGHPRPYHAAHWMPFPDGVSYDKLEHVTGQPRNPDSGNGLNSDDGVRPQQVPGQGDYISWRTYRGMESAFRRAFAAGRKS